MLSDYEGEPIILDFFATWCQPCVIQEIELNKIHDLFSNITIISISVDPSDSISTLSEFKANNNMSWTVGRDIQREISKNLSITSIPTLGFIGYSGTLENRKEGVQSYSAILEWIISEFETSNVTTTTTTSSSILQPTTTTTFPPMITSGYAFFTTIIWILGLQIIKRYRSR